ncbi:ATP-binding cassette domain-containing protein [Fulvivirgaceae bacterium BMA10]|uniref:ATP-binding cassette domain-containing protein n=1 Tax=Splendidivirga corallicola TaxID=3051826 RepID=A0ABT8KIV7_9BACT|nr:ATP-binding cassette domain-containing protein [Fulvivirgaceae bacterium BMA10]
MKKHKLEVDSIVLHYGQKSVLSDIYLKCETGDIVGVLGRNGCGKSSLLKIIFGSLRSEHSSVRINHRYTPCSFRETNGVQYLPQNGYLTSASKVEKVIKLFVLNKDHQQLILSDRNIKSFRSARVKELSTGTRKFLEVMLLLYSESKFVLLDEPFSGVSPIMIEQLFMHLKHQAKNKGVIITDHLYEHIVDISSKLMLLKDGRILNINGKEDLVESGYLMD